MAGYEGTSNNAAGLWFGARNNENTGVIGSRTASGNIAFETYSGSWGERMRITSAGNVGIGTTSPSQPLTVAGIARFENFVEFGGSISTPATAAAIYRPADNNLAFSTASTERMRIDSSGNVVVGTSSTVNPTLRILGTSAQNSFIQFADGDSNNVGQFQYNHPSNALITRVNGAEAMRIDSSGRLLVGTTTANGSMTVNMGTDKNISFTGGISEVGSVPCLQATNTAGSSIVSMGFRGTDLRFATGAAERMRIDSSGNVGIGTAFPSRKLTISKGNAEGLEIGPGESSNLNLSLHFNRSSSAYVVNEQRASAHTFFIQGNERMRLDSSGRLLVGTSSSSSLNGAQSRLQVAGPTYDEASIAIRRDSANANPPAIIFGKSRGSLGGNTVVQNNDKLGELNFTGADGTDLTTIGAQIKAEVDGTPGSNDMPGRLVFSTTADGASSPTERMRIDGSGTVIVKAASADKGIELEANGSRVARFGVLNPGVEHQVYIGTLLGNNFCFRTNNTERMRIDSSGRVAIGTFSAMTDAQLTLGASTEVALGFQRTGSGKFDAGIKVLDGHMTFLNGSDSTTVSGLSERMRIHSSGTICMAMGSVTDTSVALNSGNGGFVVTPQGGVEVAENNGTVLKVNRIGSDGTLVGFHQAGTLEGSINVLGTLVSLSGAHLSRWSQLPGGTERIEILRGSVLSNLDEMCEWAYEAKDAVLYTEDDELPEGVSVGDVKEPARAAGSENNEQLNRMKVSDIEGDKNVAGVFMCWDDDDDTYTNDFYCSMTGDHIIRIGQGVTVARGDLLMSAGDGTAKPQDDDIVRSKTVAKVTSTTVSETYADGSYCVPCVLMAC
jgi:hypothetical protein